MLKWVDNTHPDRDYDIEHDFPEFTCIHPETGLPDFGTVTIQYVPRDRCLETMSLKQYLNQYRNESMLAHTAINQILDDLVAACRPRRMQVTGAFAVRGGLTTTVNAVFGQET